MKSQSMSGLGHVISGVSIHARAFHFAEAANAAEILGPILSRFKQDIASPLNVDKVEMWLGKQEGGWGRTKKNKMMTQTPTKSHSNTAVINLASTPHIYREEGRGLGGSKWGGGQRVDHVEPFTAVLPAVGTGDITVLKGTTFEWIEPRVQTHVQVSKVSKTVEGFQDD